jgi:crotonobetainyl-CoA:carnitine CoA-transferase CaiB-like acyl-CoA transferase
MGLSQAHFDRLCGVLGRPQLAARYPDLAARVAASDQIDDAISDWTRRLPTDEVVRRLDAIDVPSAPVNAPWTTRTHAQTEARDMLVDLSHAATPDTAGRYRAARIPISLSRTSLGASGVVRPLGADTRAVLDELG